MNCYYLLKMVPVDADPLGPENVLAVSVGVTTGASFGGNSRVAISAKSPLTGLIGDSQAGGYFPAEMKFCGFDAFIFTGQSPKPVYLWVHDGEYELRDASYLWGKITGEVEDIIREELGDDKIEIAQIGPGGENQVKYACILNMCSRANGRTGMGTVMGNKKLRAIAVRGKLGRKNFQMAYPEEFKKLARLGVDRLKGSAMEGFGKIGTNGNTIPLHMSGGLPTRNFITGSFEGYEKIAGETIYDKHLRGAAEGKQDSIGRDTCFACPIRCKRVIEYDDGKIKIDPRYGGPEYETTAMMGSDLGIDDIYAISKANELCNKLGLDSISCGGTIAWAMECFERGIITKQDTGGIELKFGNVEAALQMIELIAKREGFGDLLAEGSYRAAERIGKGSEDYLVASNQQEFPAHMPRFKRSLGLIYAVNPFGADHVSSGHDGQYEMDEFNADGTKAAPPPVAPQFAQIGLDSPAIRYSLSREKVEFAHLTQNLHGLMDSLCICLLASSSFGDFFLPEEITMIVHYITGWDVSLAELLKVGERRVNMMRAFNARDGYTKEKDKLPKRMFQPMQGGNSDGFKIEEKDFEGAKVEYYTQRGWDLSTGNPSPEKMRELGLEWIVDLA